MASNRPEDEATTHAATQFATTHWTTVLTASVGSSPAAKEALEELCRAYWYPLYGFVRRKGYGPEDAKDMVQEFLARIVAGNGLKGVERGHGKFRSYLLAAMRHFLANEWDRAQAQKRGGGMVFLALENLAPENHYGRELADESTPETFYERAWASTVLDRVNNRLREEYRSSDKEERFRLLEDFALGDGGGLTYAEAGARLGIAEGTVKAEVHRLRKRYRALLRAEIAHTVARPVEINEELRFLIAAMSG